jgi:hypothetical protein
MRYITGIHALNLPCELDTSGDWHCSALQWKKLHIKNSGCTILGDYGIEKDRTIPEHLERYNVANHIRALLDLIIDGNFSTAQGMRDDFICNPKYTDEIFNKVRYIMSKSSIDDAEKIDEFMSKEYMMQWENYKRKRVI